MSAPLRFALIALAFAASAFTTRAVQSLDYDELFTVWVSSRPFADVVPQANRDGFTPPLFYALVKLVSFAGLSNESLRVLPVFFAGLAVFLGLHAAEGLFGSVSRWPAIFLIGGSAYLFTFAHELRPYSALLGCGFFFLGRLGGSPGEKSDRQAAIAAIVATAFSYLGLSMVVVWLFECRLRCTRPLRLAVGLVSLLICAPGLQKAFTLTANSVGSRMTWSAARPALSSLFFGLAPMPAAPAVETAALILLVVLLIGVHFPGRLPAFPFLARALGVFTLSVFALDTLVPIGFAPRYFALSMSALLLLMVGAFTRLERAGLFAALVVFGLNGTAVYRYLTVVPSAREDWRQAITRIEGRLGARGVLLAFPFHHAAVAAQAYAPRLAIGGGYTSSTGPLLWYEPPAAFDGYSFSGLSRIDDPRAAFERLAQATDVCVLTDEPDVRKTATLFSSFEALSGAEPLDTGDPRLRALCRTRD